MRGMTEEQGIAQSLCGEGPQACSVVWSVCEVC